MPIHTSHPPGSTPEKNFAWGWIETARWWLGALVLGLLAIPVVSMSPYGLLALLPFAVLSLLRRLFPRGL